MSNLATTDQVGNIRSIMTRGKQQIQAACPELKPDTVIRIAMTAIQKQPALMACNPVSLLAAVIEASQLGLVVDGVMGQAYLVPFWNSKKKQKEAQLQVGYRGFLTLAHRSGKIRKFAAHDVREHDEFDFEYGKDGFIRHKFGVKAPRGSIVAFYAEVEYENGGYDFEVMTLEEMQDHRSKFAAESHIWDKHFREQALKTCIRRLAKRIALDDRMVKAAMLSEYSEAGVDQQLPEIEIEGEVIDTEASEVK